MIIGKDKERVRLLEVQCKLAYELIETLRNDLEIIQRHLEKTDGTPLGDDYWRIPNDIGRCSGHLDYYK